MAYLLGESNIARQSGRWATKVVERLRLLGEDKYVCWAGDRLLNELFLRGYVIVGRLVVSGQLVVAGRLVCYEMWYVLCIFLVCNVFTGYRMFIYVRYDLMIPNMM